MTKWTTLPFEDKVKTQHSCEFETPVALLRSLSDKSPWERDESPYPLSYELNSTTAVVLQGWPWH